MLFTGQTKIRRMASKFKAIRYLQILAGMEQLEYVVVYWVLITNIEAILKKKVPKIVTGSF